MSYERNSSDPPDARWYIPVPGVDEPVGLGDLVARATEAVGIKPCPPCKRRQELLNRWLQFGRRGGR